MTDIDIKAMTEALQFHADRLNRTNANLKEAITNAVPSEDKQESLELITQIDKGIQALTAHSSNKEWKVVSDMLDDLENYGDKTLGKKGRAFVEIANQSMNSKGTLIREYRGAVDNLNKIQTTATDYMTSKTRDADDFDTKTITTLKNDLQNSLTSQTNILNTHDIERYKNEIADIDKFIELSQILERRDTEPFKPRTYVIDETALRAHVDQMYGDDVVLSDQGSGLVYGGSSSGYNLNPFYDGGLYGNQLPAGIAAPAPGQSPSTPGPQLPPGNVTAQTKYSSADDMYMNVLDNLNTIIQQNFHEDTQVDIKTSKGYVPSFVNESMEENKEKHEAFMSAMHGPGGIFVGQGLDDIFSIQEESGKGMQVDTGKYGQIYTDFIDEAYESFALGQMDVGMDYIRRADNAIGAEARLAVQIAEKATKEEQDKNFTELQVNLENMTWEELEDVKKYMFARVNNDDTSGIESKWTANSKNVGEAMVSWLTTRRIYGSNDAIGELDLQYNKKKTAFINQKTTGFDVLIKNIDEIHGNAGTSAQDYEDATLPPDLLKVLPNKRLHHFNKSLVFGTGDVGTDTIDDYQEDLRDNLKASLDWIEGVDFFPGMENYDWQDEMKFMYEAKGESHTKFVKNLKKMVKAGAFDIVNGKYAATEEFIDWLGQAGGTDDQEANLVRYIEDLMNTVKWLDEFSALGIKPGVDPAIAELQAIVNK